MSIWKSIKEEKRCFGIIITQICILLFFFVGIPAIFFIRQYYFILDTESVIDEPKWGITLPRSMEEIYYKRTNPGLRGEGVQHGIYVEELNEIDLSFRTDKLEVTEEACLGLCEKVETEVEYLPDFDKEYVWREFEIYNDKMYLLYFVDERRLHIIQDIK